MRAVLRLAAADRHDHVAVLQPERRVARRVRDQHTLVGAEVTAELRRQRDEFRVAPTIEQPVHAAVERQRLDVRQRGQCRQCGQCGQRADRRHAGRADEVRPVERPRFHRELQRLAVALEAELDLLARLDCGHRPHQLSPGRDRLRLDGDDDVSGLDPGLGRGTARAHALDPNAAAARLDPADIHAEHRAPRSRLDILELAEPLRARGLARELRNLACGILEAALGVLQALLDRCVRAFGEREHRGPRKHGTREHCNQPAFHRVLHRIKRCRPRPRSGPGPASS